MGNQHGGKLKKRDLMGYGAATIADSGPYNFVTVYLILFLTTVAGLSPERAGMITSVAILMDGISGAVIGYISDNTRSAYGRRRPYMLAAVFPLGAGLILLFTVFPGSDTMQTVIYVAAGLMFWTGFGVYYTPYTALGAELTDDYNERGTLRTYARIFGIAGNFIGMVIPLYLVQFMEGCGSSEKSAWFVMGIIMAAVSCTGILTTWRMTKGRERKVVIEKKTITPVSLVREYVSILKLKPFRHMIIVLAFYMLANTFYNSSMVFFARYSIGVKDSVTSAVFLISIITNMIYTPVAGIASVRFEKKNVLASSMLISGAAGVLFFMTGIESYFGMIVYVCIYSVSYSCFWQLINAIIYDISEVGEYVFGKRLEGSISSVYSLALTVCTSVATQAFGWILKFGYIDAAFLLFPGIFLIIAAVAQFLYPLDKKAFDRLKTALEVRRAGGDPDISGLKKII